MKLLFPVFLALLLLPASAAACVCAGSPTARAAFRESAAVFTAKYVGSEYRKWIKNELADIDLESIGKKGEYEVLVYKFEIIRWYKGSQFSGPMANEVELVTDSVRLADGTERVSDCGLAFEIGHSYLIYAFDDGQKHLATNACSRTASLARAARDIAILKKITYDKPHSGNLQPIPRRRR